jgi:hypothetical protein
MVLDFQHHRFFPRSLDLNRVVNLRQIPLGEFGIHDAAQDLHYFSGCVCHLFSPCPEALPIIQEIASSALLRSAFLATAESKAFLDFSICFSHHSSTD